MTTRKEGRNKQNKEIGKEKETVLGSKTDVIKQREHTTSGNSGQDIRKVFAGQAEDVSLTPYEASKARLNKGTESALHASKVYFLILNRLKHEKEESKNQGKNNPKDSELEGLQAKQYAQRYLANSIFTKQAMLPQEII